MNKAHVKIKPHIIKELTKNNTIFISPSPQLLNILLKQSQLIKRLQFSLYNDTNYLNRHLETLKY